MGVWHLLSELPEITPALTMAIDTTLFQRAPAAEDFGLTVRFYRWTRPAISVGANLRLPERIVDRCLDAGVDIVRRPTGGAAVLHAGDLTYSIAGPQGGRSVIGLYRHIAEGLILGLRELGVGAEVVEHGRRPDSSGFWCFGVPTGADLEVRGKKICGSAQVRRGGRFLQHGSLPIEPVRAFAAELLETDEDLLGDSTCIEELVQGTSFDDVRRALKNGFETWLRAPALEVGIPLEQLTLARRLERDLSITRRWEGDSLPNSLGSV